MIIIVALIIGVAVYYRVTGDNPVRSEYCRSQRNYSIDSSLLVQMVATQ